MNESIPISKASLGLVVVMVALALGSANPVRAQQDCKVCKVQQPITVGEVVNPDLQRQLGLVRISTGSTGCSGTLLNRFWVLTARHCVTNPPGTVEGALLPPARVTITAAWAPGRVGVPTRFYDFIVNKSGVNRDAFWVVPTRDIILIYLGAADLGEVNSQPLYAVARPGAGNSGILSGRLTTSDTVTQYGRGLSTFATGIFPAATPSGGAGPYRSAQFTPTNITETHYDLPMNENNQVGHGGDSGGPTWVTANGLGSGIAGIQSSCAETGYVMNAPSRTWMWATGISACNYVSLEPLLSEISRTIKEVPECTSLLPADQAGIGAACGLPAIVDYVLRH